MGKKLLNLLGDLDLAPKIGDLIEFDGVNWRQMHLCCATCQKICLGQIQKVKGCVKIPWNFALSFAKKKPSKSQIKTYEKFVKVCLHSG